LPKPTSVPEEEEPEEDEIINADLDIDKIIHEGSKQSEADLVTNISDSLTRILDLGNYFANTKLITYRKVKNNTAMASKFGWTLIIARMVSRSPYRDALKKSLMEFVFTDLNSRFFKINIRMEIAIHYLFEEYYFGIGVGSNYYEKVLLEFLDCFKDGIGNSVKPLDPKNRLFTKFLVEVPYVTQPAFDRVIEYCDDSQFLQLGIASLRDFIIYRPAIRDKCISKLLEYGVSINEETRIYSIMALKRFVKSHSEIRDMVLKKARSEIDLLRDFHETKDAPFEEIEEEDQEDKEDRRRLYEADCKRKKEVDSNYIISKSQLFCSLCPLVVGLLSEYSLI
jgi:hypothetical protein